jgi:hypothetical protein
MIGWLCKLGRYAADVRYSPGATDDFYREAAVRRLPKGLRLLPWTRCRSPHSIGSGSNGMRRNSIARSKGNSNATTLPNFSRCCTEPDLHASGYGSGLHKIAAYSTGAAAIATIEPYSHQILRDQRAPHSPSEGSEAAVVAAASMPRQRTKP